MTSREIMLIIILLPSTLSFGQNYQTVNPKRISYFDNNSGNINCIRIDSVKYGTDSTLFPFSNIRESSYGCYTPFGSSWIGQKIIIRDNGINVFFNKNHDSIQIKTKALLNDSWTVCNLPDSITIIANVIKQDTMNFLGLLDSVKTIRFQVFDKNMSLLNYELNNMELKVSKNFGFVSTLNFYFFPQYQNSYPFEQIEEYELIGLSNPKLGIQNLTWFEVNDFQPGDELHVHYESRNFFGDQVIQKTIKRYLERTDFVDSILYKVEYTQSIYRDQVSDYYFAFSQDTITFLVRNDTVFNLLPGEPVIIENQTYSSMMWNGKNLTRTLPNMTNKYFYSNDTCWQPPIVDDCDPSYTYINGLGGPYYECENGFSLGSIKNNLVYYKKGETIWGAPLIITGLKDNIVKSKIDVFPNPAKDLITIQIEENNQSVIFEIFDLNGKTVLKKLINSKESKIGITDLNPGLYTYRLQGNGKIFKTDKLIIK